MIAICPDTEPAGDHLLAVDVGLHIGLALYNSSNRLLWYRSHHLADLQKLKRLIAKLLRTPPRPTYIYLEGGGPLAESWRKEGEKLNLILVQLQAEQWRQRLFHNDQHSSSAVAKREAKKLAGEVIDCLGHKKSTGLRHDTAEAILVGLYGLLDLGWLEHWPPNKEETHGTL